MHTSVLRRSRQEKGRGAGRSGPRRPLIVQTGRSVDSSPQPDGRYLKLSAPPARLPATRPAGGSVPRAAGVSRPPRDRAPRINVRRAAQATPAPRSALVRYGRRDLGHPLPVPPVSLPAETESSNKMAALVKDLIEAGIHFGQRRSNWNPKMAPYIFGLRNKIHIIDIRQTLRGLLLAKKYLSRTVADGKQVCFVGTKRQARAAVEKYASDVGMPYVTERWVGGTLTNSRTIRERLKRLDELERLVSSGEIDNYSK